MPLPSVEAATREGAIAAAREKYGSSARVVAVRKTRSGGVMGFFATERYVAEVEEVEPRRREPAPLADSRRRIEAALSRDDRFADDRFAGGGDDDAYAPARRAGAARPTRDAVDELAGLLGHGAGEAPEVGVYDRASFARATSAPRPAAARAGAATGARPAAAPRSRTGATARPPATPPTVEEPAAPSLFTSALAQVVSDDSEVRAAVEEAVATAAPQTPAPRTATGRSAAGRSAARRAPAGAAPAAGAGLAAALAAVERAAAEKAAAERAAAERAEAARLAAEQEAARIAAQREAARLAKERAAAERAAAEEAARLAAEAEAARIAAEQAAAEEAARIAAEQEAARIAAEQEAARIAAEQEAARLAAEQEAARLAAEREAARIAAERAAAEEAARMAAERAAAEEAARVAAEQEAARIAAEQDAAEQAARIAAERQAAAAEAARIAAEQEAARIAAERQATRLAAEREAARILAEQAAAAEAARIAAEHEAARLAAEREAARMAEPITVEFAVPMEQDGTPEWLSEPEVAGPASVREEAIAEVLRAALAHDTSDDVLTDILRGVLSNSSQRPAIRSGEPTWVEGATESDEWEVVADVLAPTASDPAPLPLDATTILPPLSLLPPPSPGAQLAVPPLLGGRPPVPPPRRLPPVPGQAVARVASAREPQGLATVTPLPVPRTGLRGGGSPVVVTSVRERPGGLVPAGNMVDPRMIEAVGVVNRLRALGLPEALLGGGFAADIAANGTYAALTRVLAKLPPAPAVPTGPGEVLLVVGPGAETLAAARSLAASLRLDADRLQWASRGDLANLVPHGSRIASVDTAMERKQESLQAGEMTVVAVDAPLRAGGRTWLEQMLAIWAPSAVWAVVEATRKSEDLGPWLDALPRVDALMVQDTDLTADPAAVLSRAAVPVALLDGARATAHRWASLLCERLETDET